MTADSARETTAHAQQASPAVTQLARGVFALLVVASVVAFALTQRLKHIPAIVQKFQHTPFFSPTRAGHIKQEKISFRIAHADEVTVTVIDSSGNDIATLARDFPLAAYKQLSLRWNGREGPSRIRTAPTRLGLLIDSENHGRPAAEGEYRVRVHLAHANRTVLPSWSFTLVRKAAIDSTGRR